MTRTLRSSSNLRNRVRKTYYFFMADTQTCILEIFCFNDAHAAKVCAMWSAKLNIPLEFAE
jgi:hypothetical protein